jgi:cytochrome b-561
MEESVRHLLSISGCSLAAVAVGLVSAWVQNNNSSSESGYLGEPNWQKNIFAWHPALLVGGFYFGQVLAVSCWSLIADHSIAKILHALCQTAALACMIAGLTAIVKYKLDIYDSSLVTAHSWIGIAAVAVFCCNYCLGLLMAILTRWFPSNVMRVALDLRRIHRAVGMAAFGLTSMAILTGINNQLPYGSCGYDSNKDGYGNLPDACKLANGMGIAVILSSLCVVGASTLRYEAGSAPQHSHAK